MILALPNRPEAPILSLTLLVTLLGTSVVSGLVPAVNAEAILVGSLLAAPPESALTIVLIVTVGQVAAKLLLYGGGVGLAGSKAAEKSERARKIVKLLKDSKMKVQAAIQGDAVRVSGAKRDVLQEAIALVKKEVTDFPLQYGNFRD